MPRFHPLSIHPRRCSRIRSHFRCLCSRSILTRRCSSMRSHFHRLFTPSAFTRRCPRIRSHFRSFAAFSHAGVHAYDRVFASSALSVHSHALLFSHTIAYSLPLLCRRIFTRRCSRVRTHFRSRGILTRSYSRRESHFRCFFLEYHSHILLFSGYCFAIFYNRDAFFNSNQCLQFWRGF